MSDTLQSHGLQQARFPCPSPTPRPYSNSCPSSWWCHPIISSCLQSFPVSRSFPMSQFFESGYQSIGISALASLLPKNIQDWFPLGWTGLISLMSKGWLSKRLQHYSSKASVLWLSDFFIAQLLYPYMSTGKTTALTRWTLLTKFMSQFFNKLSRLVITFLPRSKHLLISWLHSPSSVILDPKTMKTVTVSVVSLLFAMKWWDQMPWS